MTRPKTLKDRSELSILSLAWPIFMETFLRMLLGNINIFMLSQYSDQAVGAIGVANQMNNFLMMIYGTLSFGTAVLVSQNLGAGNRQEAARTANVSVISTLALGVLCSTAIAVFAEPVLQLMNIKPDLMQYARPYLTIVGAASFAQAGLSSAFAISRNYGQAKIPMAVAFGMNLLNLAGNCIVVYRPFGLPDFGVTGIAVSTLISQTLAAAVMLTVLFRGVDPGLRFHFPRPFPFGVLKKIAGIGIPGAGDSLNYSAAQIVSTYIISMVGSSALTASVYLQNLISFVQVSGFSIGQATQIKVGHLIGAGEGDRAYRTCYRSLRFAILIDVGVAVTFYLLHKPLLGIFTSNPEIIAIAASVFLVDIFLEPGRPFNMVVGVSLRGSGDVVWPVIMSIISLWVVSVSLGYVFGVVFGLGLPGVYIAFALDEWVRGQLMNYRWRSGAWRKKAVVTAAVPADALPEAE